MKAKITNTTKANQGVWSLDADKNEVLTHIEPKQTRTLTFSDEQAKRIERQKLFSIEPVEDKPAKGKGKAAAPVVIEPVEDTRTDDELRAAVTEKLGSAEGVEDLDRQGLLDLLTAE